MGLLNTLWDAGEAVFSGAEAAAHAAHGATGALGTFGAIAPAAGAILGPFGMALGISELQHGLHEGNGMAVAQGGLGTLASTATTVGSAAGLMAQLGLGGAAAPAVAGAAPWVAGPAAALAAGLGIGTGINAATDSERARSSGIFGTDEYTGRNRSSTDFSADLGVSADNAVENLFGLDNDSTLGTIAGGTTAALSSIVSAPVGLIGAAIGSW